jgi:hypothetical protein
VRLKIGAEYASGDETETSVTTIIIQFLHFAKHLTSFDY